MDDRLDKLLKKIKYEEGFPPTNEISAKKGDLAERGIFESPVATGQLAQIYFAGIEKVIKHFSDDLIQNPSKFGLSSQHAIEVAINEALDSLFIEARGLLSRDFRGLGEEYVKYAMGALDSEHSGIMDYLHQKVTLHDLKPGTAPDQMAVKVGECAPKTFAFIKDLKIRELVDRDYSELLRAYSARCWKSVIILSGGAIEAILTDLLLGDPRALTAHGAPKKKADITTWDLKDLIDVSVDLKLVSPGIEKLSHPVREYRNLIHPGNEIRNGLTFGEPEARIAMEVLHMLHRDLTPAGP